MNQDYAPFSPSENAMLIDVATRLHAQMRRLPWRCADKYWQLEPICHIAHSTGQDINLNLGPISISWSAVDADNGIIRDDSNIGYSIHLRKSRVVTTGVWPFKKTQVFPNTEREFVGFQDSAPHGPWWAIMRRELALVLGQLEIFEKDGIEKINSEIQEERQLEAMAKKKEHAKKISDLARSCEV